MEETHTPSCIGFIMDGNRRWAKEKGMQTLEGHQAGYERIKEMIDVVHAAHIPHMVCYAFSTENWKRSEEEVSYLMQLLEGALKELSTVVQERKDKVCIRVIGEKARLPQSLQEEIVRVEKVNHDNPDLTVWIALSYGGRAEIIDAVNRAIAKGETVTEETFASHLWTAGMPDPDIIVRTSGEHRISNFLLWQSAYSEFFFVDTYWPDFGEAEFKSILEQYGKRKRRKGA